MMNETEVVLNVQEVGILLSALQLLDNRDEKLIASEHGSASTLYGRLKEIYHQLDKTSITPTLVHHESSY